MVNSQRNPKQAQGDPRDEAGPDRLPVPARQDRERENPSCRRAKRVHAKIRRAGARSACTRRSVVRPRKCRGETERSNQRRSVTTNVADDLSYVVTARSKVTATMGMAA
jgi:hypothetical protein